MLYDLASTPPEPGSMLESVFLLVSLRKREAELLQTEALITTILGAASEKYEPIETALKAYKNAMFPFLESEKIKRADMAKEALKQWTSHVAFKVQPLWTAYDGKTKRMHSQLRKSAERTQQAEEMRKKKRHSRI
jgi:hypothetical protein